MSPIPDDPNQAQAWITGDPPDQTIDFYIPRGNTGPMGPQGPIGPSLNVGDVLTTSGPAAPGTVGPQGGTGPKGDPGGFVAATVLPANTDLNTVITPGLYRTDSVTATTATNHPQNSLAANLIVTASGPSLVTQIAYPLNGALTSRLFFLRSYNTSAWQPWRVFNSTRVDQTAGRAIYQWDDLNNREQLIFGDTGWRDVAPLSGTVAWARLRRINNTVHVWIADWANGTSSDILTLPSGFQTGTNSLASYWGVRSNAPLYVSVNGPSSLVQAAAAPQGFTAYLTFPTVNSWPVSLPGTAHATIPNL